MKAPWYFKSLVVAVIALILAMAGGIIKATLDKYEEFEPDVFSSLLETCGKNGGPALFQRDGYYRWFAVCKDGVYIRVF